ncbi:MAG: BamA/TamA family outer membrane protein [Nitrosomonadales bacterium]|nr:BamA/TamA family outer membrane protein [Nitrosomonadales bacterium]
MRHVLLALCLCTLASAAQALGPDPHRDWSTADSAHFRVNYAAPQRVQAERIADIAERVYATLTRELHWEPSGRIEIIVLDEFDMANGFSTPYPFNESAIFLTPPDEGELLDNSIWLELLITHELTHTIHMDKARGIPAVMRQIFGRHLPLFPNLWQPGWAIEGIATYNESTPEIGQGRLRGPIFEAWMRIEHERGFKSLAEMNADGRALPTSKQYLYGVYFYDFLAHRYGQEAIYNYIHRYSGNFPLVARVHTNPEYATGKTMDVLWNEFIVDMTEQMSRREAPLKAMPRTAGDIILPANFEIDSLAPAPDGGVLAVVNDGLLRTRLQHIDAQGNKRHLANVRSGAHIDVRADGKVLIAQPEVCNNYNYYYDLYTWSPSAGMQRKTECGRYRRAVWMGEQVAALRTVGGVSTLLMLEQRENEWREAQKLYQTPDQVEAVDLAASPDGKRIALSIKQANTWQVLEFDSAGGKPRVLFNYDAPIHSLRYSLGGDGLEFIAARDGIYNLWRYAPDTQGLTRLSHTYTAVLLHSGVAQDGSVVLGELAAGGTELRRMSGIAPIAQIKPDTRLTTPLQGDTPPITHPLGKASDYNALYSMYPRAWMPASFIDRGLSAYGVSIFGSDALLWHSYNANLLWETSQHEALGSFNYEYLGHHFFSASRELWAREWTGANNDETTTLYDRTTDVQWASMLPWLQSERRLYLGIGAALQTTDRVQIAGLTSRAQDERVAAAFLRYDTRDSNWYADGVNRGNLSTLLYESYRPFNSHYDGHIVRFDTRGYLPLGRTVLSARWTEARAQDITEPFYLGGSFEHGLTQAPMLNQHDLPLRGYRGGELELRGQNARTASIEWRTPIADIDRHAMTPPVGINRLSTALFLDAGRAWDNGSPRPKYYRGVGIELLGEIRLIYLATIPLRLGVAHGMDHPGKVRGYLQLGQSF